jgi:hypothetical protein
MAIPLESIFESLGLEKCKDPFGERPAFRMEIGTDEITFVPRANLLQQKSYSAMGVINTGRTISSIETELPLEVPSREEGLALIGYFIGQHVPENAKPAWLMYAETLHDYLPWKQAAAKAAPQFSSGPLVRQQHPRVHISVDLEVKEDGSLEISGQDLGKAPEEYIGRDSYEYWMRLKPEALRSLVGALLREKYEGKAGAVWDFRKFCEGRGIEHEYGCW